MQSMFLVEDHHFESLMKACIQHPTPILFFNFYTNAAPCDLNASLFAGGSKCTELVVLLSFHAPISMIFTGSLFYHFGLKAFQMTPTFVSSSSLMFLSQTIMQSTLLSC